MTVFEGTFQDTSAFRFAIVIGRFNDLVTEKLLSGCQDCLKRHGVDTNPHGTQVDYFWVPGSFEVPLIARKLATYSVYDAIICLGAVIRGQTPHFDYVSAEAAKGVAAAGFQTGTPIIFGILTVDTMQQALERAGIKSNHGWNYALNALEMASLMQQVNHRFSNYAQNIGFEPQTPALNPSTSKPTSELTSESDYSEHSNNTQG